MKNNPDNSLLTKYNFWILILCFGFFWACDNKPKQPEKPPVEDLKAQLREIASANQLYRLQIADLRQHNHGMRTPAESVMWQEQKRLDSINMDKVESIIAKYGYPGKEMVGDSFKQVAAMIIMGNPKRQAPYVDLMWKEAQKGNVNKFDAASLEDRVLMFSGKKQKYGTQMKYDTISIDKKTGKIKTKLRVWPIENPAKVDSFRFRIDLYPLQKQLDDRGIDPKSVEGYSFFPKGYVRPKVKVGEKGKGE